MKVPNEIMQEVFKTYNEQRFDCKLPHYTVKVGHLQSYHGRIKFLKKVILINPKYTYEQMCNTLLHEMVHAYLYLNRCRNFHHSTKFWRIFKQKGGVITETNKKCYKKAQLVANEK